MAGLPLPAGCQHVIPFIVVDGAEALMAFLAATFGAVETERLAAPDGRIGHAEIRIADSLVMLSDARAENPARPCNVYVYVDDVDTTYQAAIAAGATSLTPPTNQFYGNREAGVLDPFGNIWWIATLVEAVSSEELQRRLALHQ